MISNVQSYIAILAIAVMGVVIGWFGHEVYTAVDCPEEDSCYVDYRDGEWHILEGDRP